MYEREGTMTQSFDGLVPESWCCIDCGMNTAPGALTVKALGGKWDAGEGVDQTFDERAEVCLGYLPPRIVGVYDKWHYFEQKKLAYQKLAQQIETIARPPGGNVIPLRG